ncbi:MAG: DNA translocase FtsK 4TM domain-containing protein [Firmicutes bacterium]|nr:DNA translocase FtsK 4TM domain-containing protein [Bacillota bacterium]
MANRKSSNSASKNKSKKQNKSQEKKSRRRSQAEPVIDEERQARGKRIKDEIIAVIVMAVGVFLIVAFQTNAGGEAGRILGDVFKGIFGFTAYLLPYYFILGGILIFAKKMIHIGPKAVILSAIIYLMLAIVNAGRFIDPTNIDLSGSMASVHYNNGIVLDDGGVFGMMVGGLIVRYLGKAGLYILAFVVLFICLLLVLDTPVSRMFENAKAKKAQVADHMAERSAERARVREELRAQEEAAKAEEAARLREEEKARQDRFMENAGYGASGVSRGMSSFDDSYGVTRDSARYYEPYEETENLSKKKRGIIDLIKGEYNKEDTLPGEGGGLFAEYEDGYEPKPVNTEDPYELGEGSYWNSGNDDDLQIDESNSGKNKTKKKSKGKNAKESEPALTNREAAESMLTEDEINQTKVIEYNFPPVSLLKENKQRSVRGDSGAELRRKAQKLEDVLHSFNIDADVVNVTQGPTVTRYEVHPNSGVKVKGIKSLADDIALNMEAKSIRIEAPIPGKPAVGIEIENDKINMVTVREIIDSETFKKEKSKITFAVGKDISGNEIVADLKSMPHLLIAGSTGSGKSVCINSIITSFLYKARPDEVKLVLVDPKVVELANYNGIPHLLIPVVTDPAKAAAALNWAVAEMDDRYRKFAEEGARELSSFNDHMRMEGRDEEVMPQVVIIIDELADLMITAPSQVEDSICRLAQKARAAGMHLIVATQRPSVDVITGVIKANIPSRIAFAVSSQVDSRTILDMAGAEKLVGKGDMLFNPLGTGKPVRVQGTFISDQEVNDVIEFVKSQAEEEPEYAESVIDRIERANAPAVQNEEKSPEDELLPEAIELVVQAQQASVSMLQRRFRIGYNRAARIVDMMEERQIVGPQDGSRPRQVLITEEDLMEMREETEALE